MKSIIRTNAEKDPTYAPYCGRCKGLVRMKVVSRFYWKCGCGAIHDERDTQVDPASVQPEGTQHASQDPVE